MSETERLSDWKVSLEVDKWGSGNWLLIDDNTSSLGKSLINSSDNIIWGLDLTKEDWLLELWCSGKLRGIEDSSSGWDDLSTTSMDSISMEGDIMDVESDSSHVLSAHDSFLGGPLESSLHGVLDLVKELHSLSGINEKIWSVGIWAEAPNLLGIGSSQVRAASQSDLPFAVRGGGSSQWSTAWNKSPAAGRSLRSRPASARSRRSPPPDPYRTG